VAISPSSILASSKLFSSLDPAAIAELATAVAPVRIAGGQVLFHQGAGADCLYIVASGRLRASVESYDDGERVLGDVGPGDAVGEMSILTGEPRSATVRALRDSELLRLDAGSFNRIVSGSPAMMMQISRCVIERYRAATARRGARSSTRPRTIAVVPTSRRVPLSEFTKRLAHALSAIGSVVRLTSDSVNAALGHGAAQAPADSERSSDLAEWLMAQESDHAVVLYETDLVHSQWTNRCLRQADRILVVGESGESPALGPIELAMRREGREHGGAGVELVILHRERKHLYPGTDAWLELRAVERHHHIVLDSAADCARLARMLRGTSTALVLGGGGARCFAHIGVIRAMADAGIPIDLIGGTSGGALMAALHTFGMSPDEVEAFNTHLWTKLKPLNEYTLPFVALTSPMRFLHALRERFGEANVEDFGIPFFCCSSNITKAKLHVFDRGTIWFALCATVAVPGVGPPLLKNGDVLVDGAVLDNLPVDVMRQRFDGPIVAVDVSPVEDVRADPVYTMCPSAWQFVGNRLNPFAERIKIPSLFQILTRCSTLTSVQQADGLRGLADVYIHPPTEAYGIFAWHQVSELSEVGRRSAAAALSDWQARLAGAEIEPDALRVTSTLDVSVLSASPSTNR
jgi:predicted acylesterase/phospholipase RssA/CRP-like cAMP-binding protein